jgi:hypothetical protein
MLFHLEDEIESLFALILAVEPNLSVCFTSLSFSQLCLFMACGWDAWWFDVFSSFASEAADMHLKHLAAYIGSHVPME